MPAEAPSADLAATLGGLRVERESPGWPALRQSAADPGERRAHRPTGSR